MKECADIKRIISNDALWYKKIWTLDIKNMSWVEETGSQVDFLWRTLGLRGGERVLDLACGFGRHSIELARRGCSVVGIDITKDYVDDANKTASEMGVDARFVHGDVREVRYDGEFDVVMNLADGAIGYLENDAENAKIFGVAAKALKSGGKHVIDVGNGDYARRHFPKRHWVFGSNAMSLADFDWDGEKSLMYYGGMDIEYGKPFDRPIEIYSNPTRLYGIEELRKIYQDNGMKVLSYYGDFDEGTPGSDDVFQIQVFAQKA